MSDKPWWESDITVGELAVGCLPWVFITLVTVTVIIMFAHGVGALR